MTRRCSTRGRRWVGGLCVALASVGVGSAAAAGTTSSVTTSTPTVQADPQEAAPGETVTLTIEGFDAHTVTASICGNEARRGSGDCDMTGSVGIVLNAADGPTVAVIPVTAPPVPCPCVVRVSTAAFDQIGVVPIVVTGHDIAEPVDSAQQQGAIDASISAQRTPASLGERLRASLGGAVGYDVTVTVKNTSVVPLGEVVVTGSFGRSADDFLGELELTAPGELAPGQTWQQVLRVTVPAQFVGSVTWRLDAASGTSRDRAGTVTDQRPSMLIALVLLLVADVGVLLIRWRIRRRRGAVRARGTPSMTTGSRTT